jgi:hypothetical protein
LHLAEVARESLRATTETVFLPEPEPVVAVENPEKGISGDSRDSFEDLSSRGGSFDDSAQETCTSMQGGEVEAAGSSQQADSVETEEQLQLKLNAAEAEIAGDGLIACACT